MKDNIDINNLDGFKLNIDRQKKVAQIVLDRPPLNIVTMNQREHFKYVFEKLDNDDDVRVIVLSAEGKIFHPEEIFKVLWILLLKKCLI